MKVSREQMAENRDRILQKAAQLFRERGFDGIGVADLMKAAGMTHGGFYGHFRSKEDLMAQASALALEQSCADWERVLRENQSGTFDSIVNRYLTGRHRELPGRGCAIAALGAEMSRQGSDVRQAVARGLRRMIDMLSGVAKGRSAAARRKTAITTYAAMVGALVMARAVDDAALSDEILETVRDGLIGSRAVSR